MALLFRRRRSRRCRRPHNRLPRPIHPRSRWQSACTFYSEMGRRPPYPPPPSTKDAAARGAAASPAAGAGRPARQKGMMARDQILAWQLQFRDRGGKGPPLSLSARTSTAPLAIALTSAFMPPNHARSDNSTTAQHCSLPPSRLSPPPNPPYHYLPPHLRHSFPHLSSHPFSLHHDPYIS